MEHHKKNGNGEGWLGAVIPRRRPDALGTNPEPWDDAAEKRGGLLGLHPAVKMADDYVSQIVRRLASLEEAVINTNEAAEKTYLFTSVVADGAGNATFVFNPLMGYDMDIERITSFLPPGGAGVSLNIYLNEAADSSLIWNGTGLAQRNTLDLGKGIYIPRNNAVVIVASGVTVAANAFIRMQASRRFVKQGGDIASV